MLEVKVFGNLRIIGIIRANNYPGPLALGLNVYLSLCTGLINQYLPHELLVNVQSTYPTYT